MSAITKRVHQLFSSFAFLTVFLLPVVATQCNGQAFATNLRYPLIAGGGRVAETSTELSSSLQGISYFVDWECNDYITAEVKFESLSNAPNTKDPYSKGERQVNGELQEHLNFGRVRPFVAEIYGTGWVRDNDPAANYSSAITLTLGGAVGAEVRLFRGTSARFSYEFTHWPPVYTYPGGYSKVVGIGVSERFNFISRDTNR
jgi:hypothetical protein